MVPGDTAPKTGATLVGFGGGEIEGIDRIHDEMNHVVLADPVPEIGRQKERGIVINVNEASCHARILTTQRQGSSSKSDRLLAIYFWQEAMVHGDLG